MSYVFRIVDSIYSVNIFYEKLNTNESFEMTMIEWKNLKTSSILYCNIPICNKLTICHTFESHKWFIFSKPFTIFYRTKPAFDEFGWFRRIHHEYTKFHETPHQVICCGKKKSIIWIKYLINLCPILSIYLKWLPIIYLLPHQPHLYHLLCW